MNEVNMIGIENHFPKIQLKDDYTLQSILFGHRIKKDQTLYEYMIEFLQVMISEKIVEDIRERTFNEYFPVFEDIEKCQLKFSPISRVGLKRFVFYPESKIDSKFKIDDEAYFECKEQLKNKIKIEIDERYDQDDILKIIQKLFYGISAVTKNRSWFAMSLLPVCKEVILPESMGKKSKRKKIKKDEDLFKYYIDMENAFEYHNYNFMARGGEVYYLHVLRGILLSSKEVKEKIEKGFDNLINSFWQFSELSNFIYNNWLERYQELLKNSLDRSFFDDELEYNKKIKKSLGTIPINYDRRSKYTIIELENFLSSNIHTFEKMKILAYGIVLHIIRLMHEQVGILYNGKVNPWIIDMCSNSNVGNEMKKIAIENFNDLENRFLEVINKYADEERYEKSKKQIIKEASDNSYKLIRKLGKEIGLIIPINGPGMRMSLSEELLKFLVMSLIKPGKMLRIDSFLDKLYEHYRIIIDRNTYKKAINEGLLKDISDLSMFDANKKRFIEVLKECGFVRDLSDATSIVENPYDEELI